MRRFCIGVVFLLACGGNSDAPSPDAPPPDAPLECPAGQTPCGGTCVDLQTDAANCGACGEPCGGCGATSCTAGACDPKLLATEQDLPYELALHQGTLYWGNDGARTVSIVPADGSAAASVLFPGRTQVRGFAFDATRLYFSRFVFNILEAATLPAGPSGNYGNSREAGASGVAADAATQDVYWVAWGDSAAGGMVRTRNNGTNVAGTPVTGQIRPIDIALDAENIYWTTEGIDVANGTVMKVPRAGGAPVSLATGQGTPSSIAVVDGFVYWTSRGTPGVPNTGSVNRVAIAGGAITEIAAAQPSPFSLAVDATHVTGRTRPPAR